MLKINDFIKKRAPNLTNDEAAGLKSRLIFAGINDNMDDQDTAIASDLLDKLVNKMRQSKKNMDEFVEQTSTSVRGDEYSEGSAENKNIMIALVNGRLASFNQQNNVVMPHKKSS